MDIPFEYMLIGPRAIAEIILFGTVAFVSYEVVFRSLEKLPFACSQLPGKTPMWILVLRLYIFLSLLPLPGFILLSCLYSRVGFFIVLVPLQQSEHIYTLPAASIVQKHDFFMKNPLNRRCGHSAS